MADKEHFYYLSKDGITLIHAVKWIPQVPIRAILQIAHGMVEFVERYEEFAEIMTKQGILVAGNDHLGHGGSIRSKDHFGYFAEKNGNSVLIKDIHQLRRQLNKQYPGQPYFILGHSMGSFLTRQYLCCHGEGISGAVIMGTGYKSRAMAKIGMVFTNVLARKYGWFYRSKLVDEMAFGGYNRGFIPTRTKSDWLTRDEQIVDEYLGDERCQFLFTLNGYYNLFLSTYKLTFPDYIARMPKDLPVFFLSGEKDPVGDGTKGVLKVVNQFKKLGMRDVECIFYPEDRHEILNELDRDKVSEDILQWIKLRD